MRDRPILFGGPMVRSILDGRKTQTRRVVKNVFDVEGNPCIKDWDGDPSRLDFGPHGFEELCPYGQPGERLWVKETCWIFGRWHKNGKTKTGRQRWRFRAVGQDVRFDEQRKLPREQLGYHKRPSIFMPRWANRITLEVTDVRVQRVQDISEASASAEGFPMCCPTTFTACPCGGQQARDEFRQFWNSINAKRGHGWEHNPLVWAISFRRIYPDA